ncbi:MAG: carbon starvation protein A [Phycisphaeraceae bacterium]|nr:carbon starvation protein A [Phycisphaeraceae bacterium]
MATLLIALGSAVAFLVAYHTYGRWLGSKIFRLSADAVCPSTRLRDDTDYVPTHKSIVFGHHFTSIAGTGPIVGPAIAVMWGWLPALLWVVFGSIFIGAVHDFGALVVSLRNNGQTVGDIAGRVLNRRVRILFLIVLFLALTIVLAIFGLVIAAVFRQYPASIFPVWIQLPIAVAIGIWLHRKGKGLFWPSLIALTVMYLTVVFGDQNTPVAQLPWLPAWLSSGIASIEHALHAFNSTLADWPVIVWVAILLAYCYAASVLPVWTLLQPRDYINSLQLLTALGLIVIGLAYAAFAGGAPPVEGAARQPLHIVAPAVNWHPEGAPAIFPFLFITVACGAISGFHCLVSSGTSSKQLKTEPDARFVGYGAMLTEGFLAVIVILACVAGLGLGIVQSDSTLVGTVAFAARYESWGASGGLAQTVGAFVDGSANFLKSIGIPSGVAVALMGVLVASFAGTTLDTACRLQRYVVQELAAACLPQRGPRDCAQCGYDLTGNVTGKCPECGWQIDAQVLSEPRRADAVRGAPRNTPQLAMTNPLTWLRNRHGATIFGVVVAFFIAAMPAPGSEWAWENLGKGGLILWPMFGATNQLLGGLAFLVTAFYLWRRKIPIWFLVPPLIFMLIMPAWAMILQLPQWLSSDSPNWTLIFIAAATLLLEAWMIVEAVLLWPRVKGVLEEALPGLPPKVSPPETA